MAWPLPHEDERVSPKIVSFTRPPSCCTPRVSNSATYLRFDGWGGLNVGCWILDEGHQDASSALIVIFALRTRETGQPFSAFCAASSNFALSAPGILAFTSR